MVVGDLFSIIDRDFWYYETKYKVNSVTVRTGIVGKHWQLSKHIIYHKDTLMMEFMFLSVQFQASKAFSHGTGVEIG